MPNYAVKDGQVVVTGMKRDRTTGLAIAAYTMLYDPAHDAVLDRYSTDADGSYRLTAPVLSMPKGTYEVRFFGSGLVEGPGPDGDWEAFYLNAETPGMPDPLPVTTVTMAGTANGVASDQPNTNGWWNGPVNVLLTVPVSKSGITPVIRYRTYLDPASRPAFTAVTSTSANVNIAADGAWFMDYYADYPGQSVEGDRTLRVKIDSHVPDWEVPRVQRVTSGYGRVAVMFDNLPLDSLSGILRVEVYRAYGDLPNVVPSTPGPEEFIQILTAPVAGFSDAQTTRAQYPYYWAIVEDMAGNRTGMLGLNTSSVLPLPIEPADVAGALGESDYTLTATERSRRYTVAVQLRKMIVTNTAPIVISSVGYSQTDTLLATPTWTDVTTGVTIDDGRYSLGSSLPAGLHVIRLSQTIVNARFVRISSVTGTFGASAGSISSFRASTFLAADEMDAGRIRVEDGISISTGNAYGTFLDQNGVAVRNVSGQVVAGLYNIPDPDGYMARFGGWGASTQSLESISTETERNGIEIRTGGARRIQTGILVYADNGNNKPHISMYESDVLRMRVGCLTDVVDPVMGPLAGYGLYAENVYLTGAIVADRGIVAGWNIGTLKLEKAVDSHTSTRLEASTSLKGLGVKLMDEDRVLVGSFTNPSPVFTPVALTETIEGNGDILWFENVISGWSIISGYTGTAAWQEIGGSDDGTGYLKITRSFPSGETNTGVTHTLSAASVARLAGRHVRFSVSWKKTAFAVPSRVVSVGMSVKISGGIALDVSGTAGTEWVRSSNVETVIPSDVTGIVIELWASSGYGTSNNLFDDIDFDQIMVESYETVYTQVNERGIQILASDKVQMSFLDGLFNLKGANITIDGKAVPRFLGAGTYASRPANNLCRNGDLYHDTTNNKVIIFYSGTWH